MTATADLLRCGSQIDPRTPLNNAHHLGRGASPFNSG
mgnify:CR=1 FL=1